MTEFSGMKSGTDMVTVVVTGVATVADSRNAFAALHGELQIKISHLGLLPKNRPSDAGRHCAPMLCGLQSASE